MLAGFLRWSQDPIAASAEGPAQDDDDRSVGALELFFDLVFVYAMSQVTGLMSEDVSWVGLATGSWPLPRLST